MLGSFFFQMEDASLKGKSIALANGSLAPDVARFAAELKTQAAARIRRGSGTKIKTKGVGKASGVHSLVASSCDPGLRLKPFHGARAIRPRAVYRESSS